MQLQIGYIKAVGKLYELCDAAAQHLHGGPELVWVWGDGLVPSAQYQVHPPGVGGEGGREGSPQGSRHDALSSPPAECCGLRSGEHPWCCSTTRGVSFK